jgi:hypothetical protein
MNFLTSSVVKAEESTDFAAIQLSHVRACRAHHPDGDRGPRLSRVAGHTDRPFSFDHEDYIQILIDIATRRGPARGWQPGAATGEQE